MQETQWVDSCDSHYQEPDGLWRQLLPAGLADRIPADATPTDGSAPVWDAAARLDHLDREGVWAEVVFPPPATWQTASEDGELVRAAATARNEWLAEEIQTAAPKRLIPVATLPMTSIEDAVAELHSARERGLHCAQLPTVAPSHLRAYNRDEWKPLWAAAAESGVVLAFHTGDRPELAKWSGKGEAMLNHTEGAYEAWYVATALVACGALDQHPGLRVLIAASGSTWVPFIGDRMDEAYRQHAEFIKPQLSATPKEVLYRQVWASFQYERTAPEALTSMDYQNVCWGRHHCAHDGHSGDTRETIRETLGGLKPEARQRIAEGSFRELFPHIPAAPAGASDSPARSAVTA